MGQVRFGLIGCGGMGLHLARQANMVEGARVTAVCDSDPDRAAAGGRELDVPFHTAHSELVNRDDVDAVIVASPNNLHCIHSCDAAKAGKHVFCEKPMAPTLSECDDMIAAAQQNEVKLMVAQVLRYFPVFLETRRIVESGAIGKPVAMRVTRTSGPSGTFDHGWRARYDLTGGILMEINAHELDYMRVILGDPVAVYAQSRRLVQGSYDYDDTHFVEISFGDGGMGFLHSSVAAAVGEYHMVIQGTEGTLTNGGFGGPIRYARFGEEPTEISASEIEAEEPYHHELRLFVEAVLTGGKPPVPGREGRAAVELALAAYASARTGQPVDIPMKSS
ncbi:MAG: Gfo/Idh/MocA family protein [Armatimonadota bacterium]